MHGPEEVVDWQLAGDMTGVPVAVSWLVIKPVKENWPFGAGSVSRLMSILRTSPPTVIVCLVFIQRRLST